ncbi:hypothetical protein ACB092_06G047000 [Castanea dentata]
MSFFLALPTLDCLIHPRNSIRVPWLFKISFSLLWWSARWFIHMRSNKSRLVSLNPLRLAKHWLYYMFVLNNSRDPMFARKSCQIPNPTAACFLKQVNHMSLMTIINLIHEAACWSSTERTHISSVFCYTFHFFVLFGHEPNSDPLQHC